RSDALDLAVGLPICHPFAPDQCVAQNRSGAHQVLQLGVRDRPALLSGFGVIPAHVAPSSGCERLFVSGSVSGLTTRGVLPRDGKSKDFSGIIPRIRPVPQRRALAFGNCSRIMNLPPSTLSPIEPRENIERPTSGPVENEDEEDEGAGHGPCPTELY